MSFLAVAAGGAVGAACRYAVSLIPLKSGFPWLTLVTNIIGALLIGFIVGAAQRRGLSQNAVLFLKTGVCGGFTTFSTFSLEALTLAEEGRKAESAVYIAASVVCCIAGVWFGRTIAGAVLAE